MSTGKRRNPAKRGAEAGDAVLAAQKYVSAIDILLGIGRLAPSAYVSRTPERRTLRFSLGGDPDVERSYRTHWISPELSERKRERVIQKANQAPELVVIMPLKAEWTCQRCTGSRDLLVMDGEGRFAWAVSASTISNSCGREMRC